MWNFALPLLTGFGLSAGAYQPLPQGFTPHVEIRGVLQFVVEPPDPSFAWDGYVGWRVTAGGKTYDLDLRNDPALQGLAKQLNGTTVVVRGTLQELTLAVGRRRPPGGGPRQMDARLIERLVIVVTGLRGTDEASER